MLKILSEFWIQGHFNFLCYALLANALLSLVAVFRAREFTFDRLNDYLARLLQYTLGLFLVWLFSTRIDATLVPVYGVCFAGISALTLKNLIENLKKATGLDLTWLYKWIPQKEG